MNWKKIIKYAMFITVVCTLILGYLIHGNTIRIYGGKTKVVDVKSFNPSPSNVCIINVQILNEAGDSFLPSTTVCLDNGVISSIDTAGNVSDQLPIIDGSGKFLIPGLIDSHVHLFKSQNDLLLYMANGVTSIREMIGEPDHLKWRDEIRNGRVGPDLFIASPRLGSFGKLQGTFMKYTQGFNNISNSKDARDFVNKYHDMGYDAVKIYSHLNEEAYEALCRYAPEKGMKVVGHIPWSQTIPEVAASSQAEIAHVEELMNAMRYEYGSFNSEEEADSFLVYVEQRSKEVAQDLIAHDVAVTTTIWLTQSFYRQKFELEKLLKEVALEYVNPGISEWDKRIPGGLGWLPEVNRYKLEDGLSEESREGQRLFWETYGKACGTILKTLSKEGVAIMAGTDANLPLAVPGFSLHDELVAMCEAGMSNVDVLKSATITPAQWMGRNYGKVAEGFQANLLLLDENPLDDISNTSKINTVLMDGKIYDRTLLDEMLMKVKIANDQGRTVAIEQYRKGSSSQLTMLRDFESD